MRACVGSGLGVTIVGGHNTAQGWKLLAQFEAAGAVCLRLRHACCSCCVMYLEQHGNTTAQAVA